MTLDVQIGATYDIYVPDVNERIALGYTVIRIYWGVSEDATYTLEGTTLTLVADTFAYSYNKPTALATDWAQHAFYGTTPGEGPRSEPVPISFIQSTKPAVRQGAGRRLRLMVGPFTPVTVTDADTFILTEAIDADAAATKYANWFARDGAQSRQLRNAAGAGYVPSTGTFNSRRGYSPTLSSSTSRIELWKPRGDEDPSVIIDEAMNRARKAMWYEESFFLTATANQTDYALPRIIENVKQVKRVEWAADSFPDRPYWQRIPANITMSGGIPILSIYNGFSTGTVLKMLVNRFPDRMDSETDYWTVPLEWAIAETAREALKVFGSATGQVDDVRDWRVQQKDLEEECGDYRKSYMPVAEVLVEAPR